MSNNHIFDRIIDLSEFSNKSLLILPQKSFLSDKSYLDNLIIPNQLWGETPNQKKLVDYLLTTINHYFTLISILTMKCLIWRLVQ